MFPLPNPPRPHPLLVGACLHVCLFFMHRSLFPFHFFYCPDQSPLLFIVKTLLPAYSSSIQPHILTLLFTYLAFLTPLPTLRALSSSDGFVGTSLKPCMSPLFHTSLHPYVQLLFLSVHPSILHCNTTNPPVPFPSCCPPLHSLAMSNPSCISFKFPPLPDSLFIPDKWHAFPFISL